MDVMRSCGAFCNAACGGGGDAAVCDALRRLQSCVCDSTAQCGYDESVDGALATGACLCLRRFGHAPATDQRIVVPLLRTLRAFYTPLCGRAAAKSRQAHWALSAALLDMLAERHDADELKGPDWRRAIIADTLAVLWASADDSFRKEILSDAAMLPVVGHGVYILLRVFERAAAHQCRLAALRALRALLVGSPLNGAHAQSDRLQDAYSVDDFYSEKREGEIKRLVDRGRCDVKVITAILPGILTSLWGALCGTTTSKERTTNQCASGDTGPSLWPGWLVASCIGLMDDCLTVCLCVADSKDWLDGVQKHLETILDALCKRYCSHGSALVSASVLSLCTGVVRRTLPGGDGRAVHTALAVAARPQRDQVCDAAQRFVAQLQADADTSVQCAVALRKGVIRVCDALCGATLAPDGKDALVRQLGVVLHLTSSSDIRTVCLVPSVVRRVSEALLQCCTAVPQHADTVVPTDGIHEQDAMWHEIRLCDVNDWRALRSACSRLGALAAEAGLLECLLDYVEPSIRSHEGDARRAASAALLCALLACGALHCDRADSADGAERLVDRLVNLCLPVVNDVEVDLVLPDARVDDLQTALDDRSLLLCRILHLLTAVPLASQRAARSHYCRQHVQTVVFPMLHLQASSQPLLRAHALAALRMLATLPVADHSGIDASGGDGNRRLYEFLCANLDYIVNGLSSRLLQFGRHKRAALALATLCDMLCDYGTRAHHVPLAAICDLSRQVFVSLDAHHLQSAAPLIVALSAAAKLIAAATPDVNADAERVSVTADGDIESVPATVCERTCGEMLERARHIVASPHAPLKVHALALMAHAFRAVRGNDDVLLPAVHKCWPALAARWKEATHWQTAAVPGDHRRGGDALSRVIGIQLIEVVACMASLCGTFMSRRVQEQIMPQSADYLRQRSAKRDGRFTHGDHYKLISAICLHLPAICARVKIADESRTRLIGAIELYATRDGTKLSSLANEALERLTGE